MERRITRSIHSTKRAGDSLDDDRRKCLRPKKYSSWDSAGPVFSERLESAYSDCYGSLATCQWASEYSAKDDHGPRSDPKDDIGCPLTQLKLEIFVDLLKVENCEEERHSTDRRKCLRNKCDPNNSIKIPFIGVIN